MMNRLVILFILFVIFFLQKKIIANEKVRQRERLKGPLNNNVWEYRDSPPSDWSKPIPGWETKDSYLQVMKDHQTPDRTLCTIL